MINFSLQNYKKTSKIALLLINLCFIAPYVFSRSNGTIGAPLAAGVYLFAIWRIVNKSPSARPACGHVAQVFFLDFCLAYIANAESLGSAIDGDAFGNNVSFLIQQAVTNVNLLVLDFVCIALLLFAGKRESRSWMKSIALGLMGLVLVLPAWSDCNLRNLAFFHDGRAMLVIYCIGVMLWVVLTEISYAVTDPELRKQNRWFGIVMLSVFFITLCSGYSFYVDAAKAATQWLLRFPAMTFSWVRSILLALTLFAVGYLPYMTGRERESIDSSDSCFFWMAAASVVVFRVLLSSYFVWSWVMMAAYIGYGVYLFKNEVVTKHRKDVGLTSFLIASGAVIALAELLSRGLVLLGAVAIVLCLVVNNKRNRLHEVSMQWQTLVLSLGSIAFAWQVCRRFSLGTMCMLFVIIALSLITIRFIYGKYPSNREPDARLGLVVVVCTALLLMLSSRTVISVNTEIVDDEVTIRAQAKADTSVTSMSYHWRDAFGCMVKDKGEKARKKRTDRIRSEVLVVEVLNSEGTRSSYIYYFPPWLHAFGNDNSE